MPAVAGGSNLTVQAIGGRLVFAPQVKADPAGVPPGTPPAAAAVDAAGKPIEQGATVALPDGGTATVLADVGDGSLSVRRDDDGSEITVDTTTVTVVRTAAQNAGQAGPDMLTAALADNPDATPPPGDQAAAQDPPAADPAPAAAVPDAPVGSSPAPVADPAGAAAYLANPAGTEAAWLRTDEGDQPVGYLRTDVNDPATTLRFTDTQAWAEAADAVGMTETDQVPPSANAGPVDSSSTLSPPDTAGNPLGGPGTDSTSGVDSSGAGAPADMAGVPAQPAVGLEPGPTDLPAAATAPTRLELDADVAAPDQVFAFLATGLAGPGDEAIKGARTQLIDNLVGRMGQVPDEAMLPDDVQERLTRIDTGEAVLLRIPNRAGQTFADPANPTVGEQLTEWTYREVPTGQFREVVASGQTPPEGLEVVTSDQWRAWQRASTVARAVSRWSVTAGGIDAEQQAVQEIAADLFAMADIADWPGYADNLPLREAVEQAKDERGDFYRALLLAQYQATQEAFRTAQFKALRLFRGWRSYDGTPEWAINESTTELPLRPLSSFTLDARVAAGYARSPDADSGWITTASVPVERILSTPRTGFGSLAVSEIVVLAGPGPWTVRETVETDGSAKGETWDPDDVEVDPGQPVDVEVDPFDPVTTPVGLIASRDQLTAAMTAAADDSRRADLIARARTMGLSTLVPASWDGAGAINPVDDSDQRGPDGKLLPEGDDQVVARVAAITVAIGKAKAAGLETTRAHTADGDGQVWNPDRAQQHNDIVDAVWATATSVPDEGHALLLGSLDPTSVGRVLDQSSAGLDQADYLTVNTDDIKAIMAAREMIPDIPDAGVPLSPMERAPLVHEEAAHIANLIAARAATQRKNLAWQLAMTDPGSLEDRVAQLRERYAEIKGVYVDVPLDVAATRATDAYRAGMEAFRNGEGQGGRYVPASMLRALTAPEFGTTPRAAFEGVRDQFDDWQVWDDAVAGRDPRLVYYKGAPELDRLTTAARTGQAPPETKRLPGTQAALAAVLRRTGGPR